MVRRNERLADLMLRLAVLRARMADVASELRSHESRDWEDLAIEREGDEVLEGVGLSARHEIQMIEAAITRIAAGEYGYCVRCGAEISATRLDALPFAPFCRDCATRTEGRTHA